MTNEGLKNMTEDDFAIVGFDWKDSPELMMEMVNQALTDRETGLRFARIDDECGDGGEYALLKSGEKTPTPDEYSRIMYGEDCEG